MRIRDISKSVTRLYEGTSYVTFDPTPYVYPFRHALRVTLRISPQDLILLMRYKISANCCFWIWIVWSTVCPQRWILTKYCRLTSARRRRIVKLVNFSSNSYYIILAVVFFFLSTILSGYLQIYPIQLLNSYEPSIILPSRSNGVVQDIKVCMCLCLCYCRESWCRICRECMIRRTQLWCSQREGA